MIFEENDGSKYIDLTTSWLEDKYNMLNRELFDGKLGGCSFSVITTGKGSMGRMLGRFTLGNKDLKYERRNGKIFYQQPFFGADRIYVNRSNFVEICRPEIKLNGNYKWTEKSALSTLLHEMCHYYTYMNGWFPKQWHGREFRDIAYVVSSKSKNTFPVERIASAEEMKEVELNQDIAKKNERRKDMRARNMVPLFIFFSSGTIGMIPAMNMSVANEIVKWNTTDKSVDKIATTDNEELKHYIVDKKYRLTRKYGVGYYPVQDNKVIMFLLNDGGYDTVYTKPDINEMKNKKIMKTSLNEFLEPVLPMTDIYNIVIGSLDELRKSGKCRIAFREGKYGHIDVRLNGRYVVVNWMDETKPVMMRDGCLEDDNMLAKTILLGIAGIYSKKSKSPKNENRKRVVRVTEGQLLDVVKTVIEEVIRKNESKPL